MSTQISERVVSAIDKDVPIPYHYQLREILRHEIMSGQWPVNDKIPSERELCEAFRVSRPTVREALEALVEEGLLRRERGKGTFVAEPKIEVGLLQTPFGFSDSMQAQGFTFTTHILNIAVDMATPVVARELRLGAGEPVIVLERLRSIFDEPILTVTSYLPQSLFPGLIEQNFERVSLYHLLRTAYGMTMARARRYMEAVPAPRQEAELLGLKIGAPLMLIASTTFSEDNVPFEHYVAYHRGDRARFLVESFRTVVEEPEAGFLPLESYVSS
jgi:GntR family transcriptional regulator